MTPLMTQPEISFLEQTLVSLARKRRVLECLEWGAGGSTVHFTRFLDGRRIDYQWLALEHDPQWFEKVTAAIGANPKVRVVYFDIGAGDAHWKSVTMDDYVHYPRTLRRKYDFILVDGRKRRRCLLEAASVLKAAGRVVLHDASRKYYHCAFERYRISKMALPDLWIGGTAPRLVNYGKLR